MNRSRQYSKLSDRKEGKLLNRLIPLVILTGLTWSASWAEPSRAPVGQAPRKMNGAATKAEPAQLDRSSLLRLANDLARYGSVAKSPEALTLAAQIMGQAQDGPVRASRGGEVQGLSPAGLLASARAMAPADSPASAMIQATQGRLEQQVPSYPGKVVALSDDLPAGGTSSFEAQFAGEKTWMVTATFDKGTVALEVLDEAGNVIGTRVSSDGQVELSGRPDWTGAFTVRLKNKGSTPCKVALTLFETVGKVTRS